VQSSAPNYRAQHGPYEFRSRMRRRIPPSSRVSYDTCLRCGQKGHWRNQCPVGGYPVSGVGQGNRDSGPPPQPSWNSGQPSASDVKLLSGTGKTEMYVDITIKGHTFQGLLDTGSQLNVCPYRLCKNAKITPAKTELYAANSTPISVIGTTRLYFKVGDLPSHADVVVSDEIDEFLLGCSFLRENNCELLFSQNRVVINGHSVPLRSRPNKGTVRRIFAREPVVIPPDSAMNVPVRLPFHDLRVQKSDWLVETKQIRPGLLAARTLLPHNSGYAAIVLLNMSGINQSLKSGLELGRAVACPPQVIRELESDEFDYAKSAASNNGVAISVGEADEVSD